VKVHYHNATVFQNASVEAIVDGVSVFSTPSLLDPTLPMQGFSVMNTGISDPASMDVLQAGPIPVLRASLDPGTRHATARTSEATRNGQGGSGLLQFLGVLTLPLAMTFVAFRGRSRRRRLPAYLSALLFVLPASVTGQVAEYYHLDAVGNVRAVTDQQGNVIERHDYLPFGEEWNPQPGTQPRRFTGKERDQETGLDYFGARYYGSRIGRFTTVDPNKNIWRAIFNPQKWNRYAYSLNNPLRYFDPDGQEEVTITYRTFIPDAATTTAGMTFAGDNRSFSTAADASSRTSISVLIETDPTIRANPIISQTSGAGESRRLDASGNVIAADTASVGLPVARWMRDAAGNPIINIQQNAKNPLLPGLITPAIRSNVNVTVSRDAATASVSGVISAFPGHEINAARAGAPTVPIGQFGPGLRGSPTELLKNRRLESRDVPLPPQ
jgi:RHS repeat-associated protein